MGDLQANEAKVDLQGQDEFHQQGQRAKHKQQNPKEETLYKKYVTPDRPPPAAVMLVVVSSQYLVVVAVVVAVIAVVVCST